LAEGLPCYGPARYENNFLWQGDYSDEEDERVGLVGILQLHFEENNVTLTTFLKSGATSIVYQLIQFCS